MDEAWTVRLYRKGDDRAIVVCHHQAVHVLGGEHYPPDLLDEWSPPVTDARVLEHAEAMRGSTEIKFVAERNGNVLGFASLTPNDGQVVSMYVHPHAVRRGVGRRLLEALEGAARERQLPELWLDSSLGAVPFYRAQSFEVERLHEHVLRSGTPMAAVRMRKGLGTQ